MKSEEEYEVKKRWPLPKKLFFCFLGILFSIIVFVPAWVLISKQFLPSLSSTKLNQVYDFVILQFPKSAQEWGNLAGLTSMGIPVAFLALVILAYFWNGIRGFFGFLFDFTRGDKTDKS